MHGFLMGVQNLGQGKEIILSVLCTLKSDTKCTEQPHEYKILEAGQAVGMLKTNFFSLGQGVGKPL